MNNDLMPEEEQRALANLRKIKEVETHVSIYQPLLAKIGFEHILYVHGTGERGKDFVFIDRDRFGDPVLTVCQIKSEKITGQATSNNSAYGLMIQMQQCLEYQVLNPITHTKDLPQSVILFTLYPFPDAPLSDSGMHLERIRRTCKIIGPEKVVKLIKDHLPDAFAELAYPGEGIGRAMLRYIRTYVELSAFGISGGHDLASFYVNLGFSQSGGGLDEVASGLYVISGVGTPLNCSKSTFMSIDSLSRMITGSLGLGNYFTVTSTSRPAIVRGEVEFTDSRLTPEEIQEDKKQLELSKKAGNKDSVRSDLADSLIVKLGEFRATLDRLYSLQRELRDGADQRPAFKSYVSALHYLNSFLKLMKARFSGDWIKRIPDTEVKQPAWHFQLEEFDPELLLELSDPVALVGEAGAGKTSPSRILTERAVARRIKTVYFPCSRIQSDDTPLLVGIENFLRDINALPEGSSFANFFKGVELLILDGCDEAASFTTELGAEIRSLRHSKDIFVSCTIVNGLLPYIPMDLSNRISVRGTSKKGTVQIRVNAPVSESEFDRICAIEANAPYAGEIGRLRRSLNRSKNGSSSLLETARFST